MSSDFQGTITRLLANLRDGGTETREEALRGLWHAYFERLMQVARQSMSENAKRAGDEADVVGSVFLRLWSKVQNGAFPDLHNRGELWGLLVRITRHKAIDRTRHAARLKRDGSKTEDLDVELIVSREPTPETVMSMNEEVKCFLEHLGDASLRKVVLYRLEGRSPKEIAAELGVSERTIQRKLALICAEWEKVLGMADSGAGPGQDALLS